MFRFAASIYPVVAVLALSLCVGAHARRLHVHHRSHAHAVQMDSPIATAAASTCQFDGMDFR